MARGLHMFYYLNTHALSCFLWCVDAATFLFPLALVTTHFFLPKQGLARPQQPLPEYAPNNLMCTGEALFAVTLSRNIVVVTAFAKMSILLLPTLYPEDTVIQLPVPELPLWPELEPDAPFSSSTPTLFEAISASTVYARMR